MSTPKILFAFFMLIQVSSSHAISSDSSSLYGDPIVPVSDEATVAAPIMTVTTDVFPGEEYIIGVNTNAKNEITHFYYQNEKGKKSFYKIESMSDGAVLLSKSSFDVIILYVDHNPGTLQYELTFDYLHNALSPFNRRRETTGKLVYNPRTQRYDSFSTSRKTNGKQVSSVFIEGNKVGSQLVGISSISLQ